ncbi:hypothetical protein D3C87_78880 [compost metagenome]
MAKKSFLEKLGLVESTNVVDKDIASLDAKYGQFTSSNDTEFSSVPAVDVDMAGEDFLDVNDIYERSNLSDLNRSIFKVDEYSKVLPEALATDVKRQSVIGILSASGLTVNELVADAQQRLSALNTVQETTANNTAEIVIEKETKITELLAAVDVLKQEINERKLSQENQDKIIKEEAIKVNNIVKFIDSTNV